MGESAGRERERVCGMLSVGGKLKARDVVLAVFADRQCTNNYA